MPVTEPPWINQSSGTAARNGTTSHTISFGFTSTSGNFLVVVVFGAVTHTASGWTERLSPVASGELSVFTKTSAGESSITVTHNGSNYPVIWAAYEFAADTTWTAGTSSSPSADTFPQLSSLPGTAQVVFGARGRVAGTTAATSASSTVTSPWVEDVDGFTADNGTTDGCYLYVTHQINVTATSITPSASSTYGGDWGSIPDREHVVFALDVPASGTSQPLNTVTETDTAVTLAASKARTLGVAGTTETAQPFGKAKTKALGVATEVDTAVLLGGGQPSASASIPLITETRLDPVSTRTELGRMFTQTQG